MKPFNLEAAKTGKPVCTRDGRKARIVCLDKKSEFPIVALIEEDKMERCINYTKEGYYNPDGAVSKADLVMALEPTYRPFKSAEEVLEAIKEHGGYVKEGNTYRYLKKFTVCENGEITYSFSGWNSSSVRSWEEISSRVIFADGTPFGKLEE